MQKLKVDKIMQMLEENGYIANKDIAYAVSGTINNRTPLLVEGEPGNGKTYLAKALAAITGAELVRVQMYDGVTPDKILYDYDYQRQLLTIEAIRSTLSDTLKGKTPEEALKAASGINFYDKNFLIQRPILKALTSEKPVVLLIDEIDKASEELEYSLLEILDEFSMTIPQYGTIRCEKENRPMVIMTSNNYRELSDATKRRCNYLYIPRKTSAEIKKIIEKQTVLRSDAALTAAICLEQIQNCRLKQTPSIAEAVSWIKYLIDNPELQAEDLENTAFLLAKNSNDKNVIKQILARFPDITCKIKLAALSSQKTAAPSEPAAEEEKETIDPEAYAEKHEINTDGNSSKLFGPLQETLAADYPGKENL